MGGGGHSAVHTDGGARVWAFGDAASTARAVSAAAVDSIGGGTVQVEYEEEPGEKAVTRRQIGHPLHMRKLRVNQRGRRVGFEELLAAHHPRAADDESKLVKLPRAVVAAGFC